MRERKRVLLLETLQHDLFSNMIDAFVNHDLRSIECSLGLYRIFRPAFSFES